MRRGSEAAVVWAAASFTLFGFGSAIASQRVNYVECPETLKQYPGLRPWADKLKNFAVPLEVGRHGETLVYSLGATLAGKNALEDWKKEEGRLPVKWKQDDGFLDLFKLAGTAGASAPGDGQKGWERFWKELSTGIEAELLADCRKGECKIKFNDAETDALVALPAGGRAPRFWKTVLQRIDGYRNKGAILSYEGTSAPLELGKLPLSPDMPVQEVFTAPSREAERSWFGFELLGPEPKRHKPVTALYGRFCRPLKGSNGAEGHKDRAMVCQDLVLYNNHYFDAWARQYYFFPWCGSQLVVVYELADVDQLKGSKTAQILLGSQIRKLLEVVLETRLQRLHMLGF